MFPRTLWYNLGSRPWTAVLQKNNDSMRTYLNTGLSLVAIVLFSLVWAAQDPPPQPIKRLETVETKVEYEVKYVFNRDMGRGRVKKVQNGVDGTAEHLYEVIYIQDEVVEKKLVSKKIVKAPVPAIFHMGPSGFQPSRSSFTRSRVLNMESTAYTPSAGRANPTFRTATGRRAQYGVVAVDPKVIPLNTLVFVEGYGFAIAADTGGAIKGNKIDVCVPTTQEALRWGRRTVKVHIFQGRHTGN